MNELVQAELDDMIGLLGHFDGTRTGFPDEFSDVPAAIVEAIRREIGTVQCLYRRGVVPEEDMADLRMSTALMVLLIGRRLGKLEAAVGPLRKMVKMADYTALTDR